MRRATTLARWNISGYRAELLRALGGHSTRSIRNEVAAPAARGGQVGPSVSAAGDGSPMEAVHAYGRLQAPHQLARARSDRCT